MSTRVTDHKQIASIGGGPVGLATAIGKRVQFVALLLLLLVVGVFWGVWLALSRSYQVFSVDELAHIARVVVANLAVPMRLLSMTCVASLAVVAWLFPAKKSTAFYLLLGSIGLIVLALGITVAVEVPINNQVITWTSATAPANWTALRDRWQWFNVIRVVASLTGFGLFATAILRPFDNRNN
ncbi:anthrone oxygenase family protein [Spirosoma koreense]